VRSTRSSSDSREALDERRADHGKGWRAGPSSLLCASPARSPLQRLARGSCEPTYPFPTVPPRNRRHSQSGIRTMTSKPFVSLALIAASILGLSLSAGADTIEPGSLLVFPNFDNTRGELTLLTVTNTNFDPVAGATDVEFVYINGLDCQEFNRVRTLTPNDEISVLTKFDNPNMVKGYCYVFARNHTTGHAVSFNFLIGTELVFTNGAGAQGSNGNLIGIYEVNPWTFKAIPPQGSDTDLAHGTTPPNGLRDLDNVEYQAAPNQLLFPRFLGQDGPLHVAEDLVLINLTGGQQFIATISLLIYNDNEEVFSAQFQFQCWIRVHLSDVSAVFNNSFLLTTNQNPNEVQGPPPGAFNETGWYQIDGLSASSNAAQFADPAILASQIEGMTGPIGSIGGSILPYTRGTQTNGSLLSHSLFGN
jgi:hypothetical protein